MARRVPQRGSFATSAAGAVRLWDSGRRERKEHKGMGIGTDHPTLARRQSPDSCASPSNLCDLCVPCGQIDFHRATNYRPGPGQPP